jgi:2-methylisocitrate lyase-like PEP mutase family enzyme
MLFLEALRTDAEIEAAAAAFPDTPLLFNWVEGGKTPPTSLARLTELGYRLVIFPVSTLLAATSAVQNVLAELAEAGTPTDAVQPTPDLNDFFTTVGLPDVLDLGKRYDHD